MDIAPTVHVDGSRVVESVNVPKDSTNVVDNPLLESTITILVTNFPILFVVISQSHAPIEICVCEKSTSDIVTT